MSQPDLSVTETVEVASTEEIDAAHEPLDLEREAAELAEAELAEKRAAEEAEAAAVRAARLKLLMQRVAKHADFAAMRNSIEGIQKVARSDKSHVSALTAEIAEDVAMTGKLLRLINAAFYSSVGGGGITSMKRAVDLMGFQSIGMLASSLVLFERLPKHSDGDRLRQEFGRAQFAAMLAHEMCNHRKHIEGAYMTALFQNLGGMLGGMHFSEEISQIETQLDAKGLKADDPARHDAKERLARDYWGIGIEEIGIEVAAQWGWPETLRTSMRSLRPSDNQRAASSEEYLRVMCTGANQLAGDLLRLATDVSPEEQADARKACVNRFAANMSIPLNLDPEGLLDIVERTKVIWDDLAKAMGFGPAKRKSNSAPSEQKQPEAPKKSDSALTKAPAGAMPVPMRQGITPSATAEVLASALEQASALVLSGAPRGQLLQLCMKTMFEALQLQRVILCLRDPKSGSLQGKMGLGDRAVDFAAVFTVPLQPPSDLFGLLCLKSSDTLISDTSDRVIAQRLPNWFGQLRAQSFVFLPMVAGSQVLGAIYGDHSRAGCLSLGEREMSLLKTLRNQVVMALHSGSNAGPGKN